LAVNATIYIFAPAKEEQEGNRVFPSSFIRHYDQQSTRNGTKIIAALIGGRYFFSGYES